MTNCRRAHRLRATSRWLWMGRYWNGMSDGTRCRPTLLRRCAGRAIIFLCKNPWTELLSRNRTCCPRVKPISFRRRPTMLTHFKVTAAGKLLRWFCTRMGKIFQSSGSSNAECSLKSLVLEESGYALFHDNYAVFGSGGAGFLVEELQRLIHGFVGEAEGAVVHGDHPARFEIDKGAHGVGGIGVDVAKLRRIVGANGEQGEFGSEAASDFAEAGEVGGVAGVIDGVFAGLENEAAVAAVRIFQNARAPVARRHMRYRQVAVTRSFPPVQFDDLGKAEIGDQVRNMRRNDDRRGNPTRAQIVLHQGAQRRAMKVIEVGVRNQHEIDGRQIGDAQAWTAQAFQDEKPAREIGVDHDALPADLHEETGVADEGDAEFSVGGE